jgi:hypothetical protein
MKEIKSSVFATTLVFCGLIIGLLLSSNSTIAQRIAAITGNGTTGHLAKWVNSSGALGDSKITEDKDGNISVAGGIKFPDGSLQTTASTNSHLNQTKFTISLGQTHNIELPVLDSPVRIEISITNMVTKNNGNFNPHFRPLTPITLSSTYTKDSSSNLVSSIFSSEFGFPFEDGIRGDADVKGSLRAVLPGTIELSVQKAFASDDVVAAHDFNVCINIWY